MIKENYRYDVDSSDATYALSKYAQYICGAEPLPENCNLIIKSYGYILSANHVMNGMDINKHLYSCPLIQQLSITATAILGNAAIVMKNALTHPANAAGVVPIASRKSSITAPMIELSMTVKICCGTILATPFGSVVPNFCMHLIRLIWKNIHSLIFSLLAAEQHLTLWLLI